MSAGGVGRAAAGSSSPNSESCDRGSLIADVILTADAGIGAARAQERFLGLRRKAARLDAVDRRHEPADAGLDPFGKRGRAAERYERILLAKGDVAGPPERPAPA